MNFVPIPDGERVLYPALTQSLADHPDAVIGNLASQETARMLLERSAIKRDRLAESLEPSSQRRLPVAIIRRNSPAYVSDLLAVLGTGHVPVLMDPALGPAELTALFTGCGVAAVLHDDSATLPDAAHPTDCAGSQLTLLPGAAGPELHPGTELCRLTSGSTRTPGCIEFRGTAVLAAADAWCEASGLSAADRVLCFAGLYNGLGFNAALIPGIRAGASLYLPSGLPSGSNIRRHLGEIDPTVLVAFPAAYDRLAASVGTQPLRHRLRLALSSAARLKAETSVALAGQSIGIADYYGLAETGPLTFNANPVPGGGQGYPVPGASLRFDGDEAGSATIVVRSRSMGTRYLNYPGVLEQRITDAGYYRTSDLGSIGADGELHLGERIDNSFSVGGKKFTAAEVEELLVSHPGITESAVAMVTPDADAAPLLGALIVCSAPVELVEVRRHCLARAAPFKVPVHLVVVPEIPRNGAGKVQTTEISRLLLADIRPPKQY
ncbi:class I adenylate-forming enzyme family protein [Actinoalloteichus hymeniacidonis]|uniref:Acyl-CoA synthetase (AMP-forming)/AMP-acid ligase II n=1 Tax=Actinoalloteichus hymeniacidonis TaxID=340345 RepID=A0AAC9HRF4_9PSEU|nr:class I adenylate-forming enzyme family protein [Actinoalloteichus hymeniacidonis]AOS63968.1 acyl-CoA synthetase (AMP-forming)/AMP-acid ligase II [Actinoalloteichus hymeniacidonis]MBB5907974.1 acyl-CoA synthetase (AMP-forming)/AMP-acid ligase II [Actinoalloteichus hymeniacidonis]